MPPSLRLVPTLGRRIPACLGRSTQSPHGRDGGSGLLRSSYSVDKLTLRAHRWPIETGTGPPQASRVQRLRARITTGLELRAQASLLAPACINADEHVGYRYARRGAPPTS